MEHIWHIVVIFVKVHLLELGIMGIIAAILWERGLHMAHSLFSLLLRRFFAVKIGGRELVCWHIEREESSTHSFPHCHEYNFEGEICIKPRKNIQMSAFYVQLQTSQGIVKARYQQRENLLSLPFPEVVSNKNTIGKYVFQVRLPNEFEIPKFGYVVVELESTSHNKRRKMVIERNDEYRPTPKYMERFDVGKE